jgi:ABC-type methionine transport system ATPase subunit
LPLPVLSFESVSKRHRDGYREIVVLDNASFDLDQGTFIGVWGSRRAGKSTLLRLMAGVETPDAGVVRFDGQDMGAMTPARRERLLRSEIALMTTDDWQSRSKESVVDHVALSIGSSAVSLLEARRLARRVLDRVGIASYADELTRSLSVAERTRVMLARALVREPRLLLVDEPALVPSLMERDALCDLLREVSRDIGATLVVASEEMAPLHGAEVVMSVGDGELCSTDERGQIIGFPGGAPTVPREP